MRKDATRAQRNRTTLPNMLGILLLAAVAVGGSGQGYLGFPEGCDRDSCSAYVQWTLVDSGTIRFELEGADEGWVAVGVSAAQLIDRDDIEDVFVCQRDAIDNVTVYAQDMYNTENQTLGDSKRDSNQNGFERTSSSYDNGRISCTFTRSIVGENMDEDRNLDESAYLLLATGSQRAASGSSNITLDYHGYNNKWSSSDPVTLAKSNGGPISTNEQSSGGTVALFDPSSTPAVLGTLGFPEGCQKALCNASVQWALGNDDTVQFELEGAAEGWVAVGVSADQVMGGDGIDDVFACQRDATNNVIVYAQDMYNPENQSPRSNKRDSNQNGFNMISSSYDGGRISCTFTRSILADNLNEDRNLNESAYLLLAIGAQRATVGSTDVTLAYHGYLNRWPSADKVTLAPSTLGPTTTTPIPSPSSVGPTPSLISPSPSPTGKGEFSTPGCEQASCTAYVQWTLASSDTLEFELEGEAEGWVAVGVSADQVMGGNGIDDVFACQRDATGDIVYAQDTYNPQDQSTRGNKRDSNQNGFKMISSSYDNGRISCTFTRSILADNLNEDRNLNESAYLLLAAGSTRGGPDVVLAFHDVVWLASAAPVLLTRGQKVVAGCETNPLIRAHGILMYIAWVWLAPIAYFFAAYMKPAMPGGAWFQIHRALMVIALVLSVAGFILIFVAFRDSGNPNGLITLGEKFAVQTTHFVFGWIIIILQLLNPIISLLRCKPDSMYRWIFDLVHGSIVGWVAIILASINVGIGIWIYSPWAFGQGDVSHYYPFWVWLAFSIMHLSLSGVYSRWIPPEPPCPVKKSKEKEEESKEKPPSEEEELKEVPVAEEELVEKPEAEEKPPKEPSEDAPLRYGIMVFDIVFLIVPGVVVMVLIGYGCI